MHRVRSNCRVAMHLLFLNHNYKFSGTYYRAMPMAERLVARGHTVTLFTVSRTQRWRATWTVAQGVHLCEAPNLARRGTAEGYAPLDILLRMGHALGARYDIIHMFDHKPNATFPGFVGRGRGARLVADWADWWGGPGGIIDHGAVRPSLIDRFENWWELKSKLCADGVVTISTVLQQRALMAGCAADRVIYVPTGAATERIWPLPIADARAQLGIPLDRKVIGFVGMGQGDLEIVLRSLQQLPEVWLMVIGRKLQPVTDLAHSLGVADRLWQTDFVPDDQVNLYLGCANLMCLPLSDRAANRGRLPNKLLDYMAAGRPTVASPVGDVQEIIRRHEVGLLATDEAFAPAIRMLLDDPPLATRLGQKARQVAENEFGWPTLIGQLEMFYLRLLQRQ